MTEQEYKELQSWLSYKLDNGPYKFSHTSCDSVWRETILIVKSKVNAMYRSEHKDDINNSQNS